MTAATIYSYTAPGISVQQNGPLTQLLAGALPTVLLMVGTAPSGPDFPVLTDFGTAFQMFGLPNAYTSAGYSLPLGLLYAAMQKAPNSNQPLMVLACRVGNTRPSIAVTAQTSGTSFTLSGIGKYSGAAGNGLKMVVTLTSTAVTHISIQTAGGQSLQDFYSALTPLGTNAQIIAAINGANPLNNPNSIVQAGGSVGANLPAAGSLTLAGGVDLATGFVPASDASIPAALANSLWTHADYGWLGFDYADIESALAGTHLPAAVAVNEFRKFFVGPKLGTNLTAATLTTVNAANAIYNTPRVVAIGHDGAYTINPITGNTTVVDGYYLAAALAGLKAVSQTAETCDGYQLAGFTMLAAPGQGATEQSLSLTPTTGDYDQLAGGGFTVLIPNPRGPGLVVRELLTSASLFLNNQLNPFSQLNVQAIDDAVANALVQAVLPFKGRPAEPLQKQLSDLQQACVDALGTLGTTINGINSVVVTIDPTTLIPTVIASYITRYPLRQINIITNFTFL